MSLHQRWCAAAVVTAVIGFLAGRYLGGRQPEPVVPASPPGMVDQVLRAIRLYYVDSLSDAQLTYLAAQAIVERLQDPYSTVLQRERARRSEAVSEARATGDVRLVEKGVGYVALRVFTGRSADDLREAILDLHPDSLQALILDLRDNPGGLVNEAVKVADLFLDIHLPIATVRGRTAGNSWRFASARAQEWPDLRLAVLVNERTRSAAELVAGALQEHDRAAIVGKPTYGKGTVQQTIPLSDTVGLRLTTARWYTAGGRRIDGDTSGGSARWFSFQGRPLPTGPPGGVMPDFVAANGKQLQAAVDLVRHARTTAELLELAAAAARARARSY